MTNKKNFLTLVLFVSFGLFIYMFYSPNLSQNSVHQNFAGSNSPLHQLVKVLDKKAYLVHTSKCQIIHWPPFDEQVMPLYENKTGQKITCNTDSEYDISIKRYNFTGIKIESKSNADIECFSSLVIRSDENDDKITYTPTVEFKNNLNYFPNDSVVKIHCMINKGHKGYDKVIPLIPDKRPKRPPDMELPNILFFGLDSVSRVNFDRHFPITSQLLKKHNFYTMYGYNKVADNTFVNLTPLLTGHYLDDIWNETISKTVFLNYFPFIWKDYENKGFQTLLLEDTPKISTFNYLKIGFSEPPTSYYLRPFSLAIENNIKNDCYLNETEIETYYEYLYDFLQAMDYRKQKYFAFAFVNRLTHDELNKAGLTDPIVAKFFDKLFDQNLLSNTILVFFSDHGIRFGPIRETLSGKLEERMPLMHLYLPEKWRNKYDKYLTINQNRLTTPFDIHATLTHIIRGEPNYQLRYGKTLFEEIPEDRSCNSIPILEHWCSCQTSEPINNLEIINPISEFIVKSVNGLLSEKFSDKCVELKLDKIISAYEQHLSDKVLQFEQSLNDVLERHVIFKKEPVKEVTKHYMLTIKVKPSNALFEATVSLNTTTGQTRLIGEISRINYYGNQSTCINDQFMRRYCFCKNDTHSRSL